MKGHRKHCPLCELTLNDIRQRLWTTKDIPDVVVRTWCRICTEPIVLGVPHNFDIALRFFYMLDDHPMTCRGGHHYESGGWGVHWQLDEVLAAIFDHQIDRGLAEEYWPMASWYDDCGEPVPLPMIVSEGEAANSTSGCDIGCHINEDLNLLVLQDRD